MNPDFLREAIRLAVAAVTHANGGPFGALVVRDGSIVGRGTNRVTATNDPTAHAEIVAIREACALLRSFSLAGCDIYCSCEPCPMCLAAIYWARLDRVWFAATRDDAAAAGFDDRQFYEELARPLEHRAVPMQLALRDAGRTPFDAWSRKADRIPY